MTTRDRRLATAALFVIGIVAGLAFTGGQAQAGRGPDPTCCWEGTTLRAENLPDEWSLTTIPRPTGVVARPSTYEATWPVAFTAYFWTRGGPYESLFKPGRQLNDYRPFCIAEEP